MKGGSDLGVVERVVVLACCIFSFPSTCEKKTRVGFWRRFRVGLLDLPLWRRD